MKHKELEKGMDIDIKSTAITAAKMVVGFLAIGVTAYQLYEQLKKMDRLREESSSPYN